MIKLLFLIIFYSSTIHDFYSSITIIEFNEKTKTFEITAKFFEDDFTVFMNNLDEDYSYTEKLSESARHHILTHFKLIHNQKQIPIKILGTKIRNDILFLFIESTPVFESGELMIRNTMLLKSFEDQINIIQLKKGTARRTQIISNSKKSVMFKWPQDIQD